MLTACEKACYKFNVTTVTTSKYSSQTDVTNITKCDLTAKEAKKTANGLESTATSGTGNNKVTVTTTCSYTHG